MFQAEKEAILERMFEKIIAKQFPGKAEQLRELVRAYRDGEKQPELPFNGINACKDQVA